MLKFIFNELAGKEISEKQEQILSLVFQLLHTFEEDEIEPPSSMVALQTSICGHKFPQVVSSSINCFGLKHGCFSDAIKFIKNDYKSDNNIYSGFGHPKYKKQDPRVLKVLNLIRKIDYSSKHINQSINFSIENNIPINIGGITACILLDIGCDETTADYFLIISRCLGFAKIHQKVKKEKIKFGNSYEAAKQYNTKYKIKWT